MEPPPASDPRLQLTAGISYDTSMSSGRTRPLSIPLGALHRYAIGFKQKRRDGPTIGGGLTWLYEGNVEIEKDRGHHMNPSQPCPTA